MGTWAGVEVLEGLAHIYTYKASQIYFIYCAQLQYRYYLVMRPTDLGKYICLSNQC